MKPKKQRDLPSVLLNGVEYKPGDCVLINPDARAPAYVGRIKKLLRTGPEPHAVDVEVTWFYRPEEALGGRKAFHGEAELFASDHRDTVPLGSVLSGCTVHGLDAYEALATRTETDFYSRFTYLANAKQFIPESVPVYCLCEQPHNPDRPMVMCEDCEDWFHPACLKLGPEALQDTHFTCPNCAAPKKKLRAGDS